MTKELLIFGSEGALGRGITSVMTQKDYDKIYLFDKHYKDSTGEIIEKISIDDLSIEENTAAAFNNIKPSKDKLLFLYSTVGGYTGGKTIAELDPNEWDNMFDINLKSSFLIAKYFSKLVKESAGGGICYTAAAAAIHPAEGKAAYSASKSALINLVHSLSREGRGIRLSANAIAPYIIDTPANREWLDKKEIINAVKPEEIGELAHSLFNHYNFLSGNVVKLEIRFE